MERMQSTIEHNMLPVASHILEHMQSMIEHNMFSVSSHIMERMQSMIERNICRMQPGKSPIALIIHTHLPSDKGSIDIGLLFIALVHLIGNNATQCWLLNHFDTMIV